MPFFRSNRVIRLTAIFLIIGLVMALSSGTARAEERTLDYSLWVGLHLPGDAPESVLLALKLAGESKAHSLDEFLETFLREIKRSESENDVAEWLYGKSVDHSTVHRDLRLRLIDVASSGLLNRLFEVRLVSQNYPTSHRVGKSLPVTGVKIPSLHRWQANRNIHGLLSRRISRYQISAAEPQGP